MTLDDAIVAFGQLVSDNFDNLELDVRDYERLVNWLTELKLARESAFSDIGLSARAISENNELKAENAKLRELVKDAWGNGHPDRSCGECDIRDDCHADMEESRQRGERYSRCLFERRIEERMRELGIEVSE